MPFTLHSHSGQFCNHGHGTLTECIECAISKGFFLFGLSEHVPRFEQEHLYPEESHLTPTDLSLLFEDYLKTAYILAHQYRHKIKIIVGCESEFINPESLNRHLDLFSSNAPVPLKPQFTVGSLHHLYGIPIDFDLDNFKKAYAKAGNFENLFVEYFDRQYDMLRQLKPEVVGHFDLIRLFVDDSWESLQNHETTLQHQCNGHSTTSTPLKSHSTVPSSLSSTPTKSWRTGSAFTPLVWTKIKRNVEYIIAYGGLFEINSRAWKKGLKGYPCEDIAKVKT
ncbi:Polymerase/histidinol phosphatase-like protein [Paraphysoderma sedebokerense]|nr:Polymerase/histidinol phosphatase-like protein [Paraphysoderma sedebokerense]